MSSFSGNKKTRGGSNRKSRNSYTTRSGQTIKINRNLGNRLSAYRDVKARSKAERLAGMPKSRFKRSMYRLQPQRLYQYWFSREGGIMALKILGIGILAGFILLIGIFAYFRKDLPNLRDISGGNLGGSISYYDRTGQTLLWEDYDAIKRIPVTDNNISQFMKDATVAVEDKDFFKHGGFDVRGIARAGFNDAFKHGGTQGGSTITQQLVKLNNDWSKDRTITRKVKELILAVELERSYSKQEILTGYLNAAPYGNIEYGVQAATNDYFHKDAKDLTLDEAAFLAAIPKSPSYYSPYGSIYKQDATPASKDLIGRRNYVLDQMTNQGRITKKQADEAKKSDTLARVQTQKSKYAGIKAPYFVTAAKKEVEQRCSTTVKCGGWKVITTMDSALQKKAEDLVAANLVKIKRFGADNEALVTEDVETGQIVASVGGVDFNNPTFGQNNFASNILLPPGSSFKPYDYTAFIDTNTNVGAGSVLYDSLGPLPGYACTNKGNPKNGGNCLQDYDFLAPGPLTLRYALGGSRNIPAVKAMLSTVPNDTSNGRTASINKVISTASAMMANHTVSGNTYNCYSDEALTKTTQCYGASAIGDGAYLHLDDHVNGLSTLGRMGKAIPRTYILNITDAGNKNIYKFQQPQGKQVIKADSAYIVNDMASDPRASYLPGSCSETSCTPLSSGGYKFHRYNGWKLAIKTGTTNDGYDGLMTSWSPKYATVAWVGNHTRHVTLTTSMEVMTEPLVRGMMEAAHADKKASNWVAPANIKSLPAFIVRNHIHYGDIEPSPTNDLFPSWYTGKTNASTNQTIDKISGKVATNCTPALAKDNQQNSNAASWNVDVFAGGTASSGSTSIAAGNDDVHVCGEKKPEIRIMQNGDGSITAIATPGAHPLSSDKQKGTINFLASGQVLQSFNVDDGNPNATLPSGVAPAGSTVTAQVIDSVLYDATSDGIKINEAESGGGSITGFQLTSGGNTVATLKWNAYPGASGYTLTGRKGNQEGTCIVTGTIGTCTGLPANGTVTFKVVANGTPGTPEATTSN